MASEEQRGSQWDHCADGVGAMVSPRSCGALKAMGRVQISFKMRGKGHKRVVYGSDGILRIRR